MFISYSNTMKSNLLNNQTTIFLILLLVVTTCKKKIELPVVNTEQVKVTTTYITSAEGLFLKEEHVGVP